MAKQFSILAEKIVTKGLLKKPPCPKKKRNVEEKVMAMIEQDERLRSVRSFLEIWNKWRDFYFELSPVTIRTKSQLTTAENAVAFINEHGLNMQIMVAAVHRAYRHRKFRPNFSAIKLLGLECYDEHYDYVIHDVEEKNYLIGAQA